MASETVVQGIPSHLLRPFLQSDERLAAALQQAEKARKELEEEFGADYLKKEERELAADAQSGFANFYHPDVANRYVPVAARGPWIVTLHGAVLYDVGGYGMLGFGHNNPELSKALARDQCMANIMTPSFSQKRFIDTIRKEIGHSRGGECPYAGFMCLNSGSEAVGLAGRLSDINAHTQTKEGGPAAGKTPAYLVIEGSFHGRVTQAAHLSQVCHATYRTYLASFQPTRHPKVFVAQMNNLSSLRAAFDQANQSGCFVELLSIEPVMGEGLPGVSLARDFYDLARELTIENHSLLLIDSIQAGIRCSGSLSIVDYPGFENAPPPDFETFSKALNGGQYPLSVLALGPRAKDLYKCGTYGNTMTGNPRALDIGTAMLKQLTPEVRHNIQDQGVALLAGLRALQTKYPTIITSCEGLGLIVAANIDPKYEVVGWLGLEQQCRHLGLNIIHCGDNALRFTPVFDMRKEEVQLCLDIVETVISKLVQ